MNRDTRHAVLFGMLASVLPPDGNRKKHQSQLTDADRYRIQKAKQKRKRKKAAKEQRRKNRK